MSTQWGESRHFQEYKIICRKYDCKKLKGDFSLTVFTGQPDHLFSKLHVKSTGPIVDKKSWICLNSCIKNTIPSKDIIHWQSKTSFPGSKPHILHIIVYFQTFTLASLYLSRFQLHSTFTTWLSNLLFVRLWMKQPRNSTFANLCPRCKGLRLLSTFRRTIFLKFWFFGK